jgi:ApbE superfamily uncharacterized protein (UPF0280 family)
LFEPRLYRRGMGNDRFAHFTVDYKETDMWIGIDRYSFKGEMANFALLNIMKMRDELESYGRSDTIFLKTLSPYKSTERAPQIVLKMCEYGKRAQVGPMASVAGVFSQMIGRLIEAKFHVREIIVENGGDIYLNVKKPVIISVYAGGSPLSKKIGIKIDPGYSPLGVCTSSGTVGHSFSHGKADAVVIICKDAGLADAYATAFGNKIHGAQDIGSVLEEIAEENAILGALIVVKDKLGIRGDFPLEILSS